MSKHRTSGGTLWLTGLSGAGKSTLAERLVTPRRERGERVELLDGDELRTSLSAGLGFSREDRNTHMTRVGFVAELLARNDVWAVVLVIAPPTPTHGPRTARAMNAVEVATSRCSSPRRSRSARGATSRACTPTPKPVRSPE